MAGQERNWGSLQAVEDLIGCHFDVDEAEKLSGAPDDQLSDFLARFAPAWYDWLESDGIAARAIADKPLYLPSGADQFGEEGPLLMSSASYKRAALCFSSIAVPDLLAAAMHPSVETGQLIGSFSLEEARTGFRAGLMRLAEIAPLVRAGAFAVVPHGFGGLHPILQAHAREELKNVSSEDTEFWAKLVRDANPGAPEDSINFGIRFLSDEVALALAWVATTGAWPITTAPHVFERIEKGLAQTADKGKSMGIEVARAITTFQLLDASGVDWELLSKIRADDHRFADFRANLDLAIVQASKNAGQSPQLFAAFLKDLLQDSADECSKAGGFSSSWDGMWGPTFASLSIATMFAIVCDLTVPGGPWMTRLRPFIASMTALCCEASASWIRKGAAASICGSSIR
ncbi:MULTISPECIES: hypothetical protein [unclassified Bradyrhizobium]|uniref:hypothetical protein n=1 Tax=unclassified Bradyrhizobium TaxID=2631580 RepID=UPI001CD37E42|nr:MULTISPECIES: hypothetical protein [unclassified Bradyrhizobium]MCA1386124.1 hypothetical protein [Bradyrhizobium sp. BRP05]MCA1423665.1 hypothetical protein [Bradyrhizobium sp. BRP23]MCA1430677.1 hypothetical protein [Bradyrhizobium sp. NBAIM16]MCA1480301.1 hypothetical protein [Bradyrhizobium sp. NBAIM08]MCA1508959.1 hypothetical protein [Bradyrhizobium sp. NBAIM02]